MKQTKILLITLLLAFALVTKGQSNLPKEGPSFYFNSFEKYNSINVDSSIYFLKLLAMNPADKDYLQDLLHNFFAQSFLKELEQMAPDSLQKEELRKGMEMGYKILDGVMSDTNQNLINCITPIYYWTKVQENENDSKKLIELTNKFIETELSENDIYQNRIGRYALLIYQVISQKSELKSLADQLFKTTITKLQLNLLNVDTASGPRYIRGKRTWYRYLYAYSNSIMANRALEQGKDIEAGKYFKIASDYSPDSIDNSKSDAYFYDMYFLLGKEKKTLQDDYLTYLKNHGSDKKLSLSILLTMALTNPIYKEQLKSYYHTNFSDQENFSEYWQRNSSRNLKNAPVILLKKTDGVLFSSEANKGKWMLIDFWGTWCGPCRAEHPDMEKFYQTIKSVIPTKIVLLTVACRDHIEGVTSYMNQFNYSFPVAMADSKIESIYNISSYPSKILITPQGKYLIVPFGIDWVDFIKKYIDL